MGPRHVLAQNAGYFRRHADHMNYPQYRQRAWPIGSGMTEAAVKQFNKRVKGTEPFWHNHGVEPLLALRSLWLSDDDRWDHILVVPIPPAIRRLDCQAPPSPAARVGWFDPWIAGS